jgi:hypothetical protein
MKEIDEANANSSTRILRASRFPDWMTISFQSLNRSVADVFSRKES